MTIERHLSLEEVCELLGVSKQTIMRWVREGRLPSAIRLTKRTTRWRESEIQAFLARCEEQEA